MKKKNIIILALARFLTGVAGYIYDIGIVIYLFHETGSATAVGGFFVSQLLPAFIILIMGNLIDHVNHKKLLILSCILKIGILLFLNISGNMWCLYVLTFGLSLLAEFEGNTFQAVLGDVFEKEQLLRVGTILNFGDSVSMVFTPFIAAMIAEKFSYFTIVSITVVLYLGTLLLYLPVRLNSSFISECSEEVSEKGNVYKRKPVIVTTFFWSMFMLCIGITSPLEIIMIEDVLNMSSLYYGIGNTVEGIGMLFASGVLCILKHKINTGRVIAAGLIMAVLSYGVIGISNNIRIYFIGAFFVGATATCCPLGFKYAVQTNCSIEKIGRVFTAVRFTVLLFRILGIGFAGLMLRAAGIRCIYIVTSAGLFLLALMYIYVENVEKRKQ
ncbi:MAG: MFS transporter [Eubacteriales bacterium]|nr:MFS transporter [Eubacteriales bacterium]